MVSSGEFELPDFGPVGQDSLQEQVYRELRQALMSGKFSPGQALTIRAVADAFNLSPMPVREALKRLCAEHALVTTGTSRVRIQVPGMSVKLLQELRDARVALEGMLAARAATLMTAAALDEISRSYVAMEDALHADDVERYLNANFAFHRTIYQVAASEILLDVVETFWLRMGPFFTLIAAAPNHLSRSMKAHKRILRALELNDPEAARAAVADDINNAAEHLEKLFTPRFAATSGTRSDPAKPGQPSAPAGVAALIKIRSKSPR